MVHFDANVFVCITLLMNSAIAPNNNASSIMELLDQLVDKRNYDKRIRPNFGGEPVFVELGMYVMISDVSDVRMEFTVDMYLRQYWLDPRLEFSKYEHKDVEYIQLDRDGLQSIWVPDTSFANQKYMSVHEIPTHLHNTLIRIKRNGRVLLSQRFQVIANCPMNLYLFPFDSQRCKLELGSFGYSTTSIVYMMRKNVEAVTLGSTQLGTFVLKDIQTDNDSYSITTGGYQSVTYSFHLRRSLEIYIFQIYLPCIFLVVISWFSFWMSPDLVQGRIGLGVLTVLTITMFILQTKASLPKVSYRKSADVYMEVCFLMVFAACLESMLVGFLTKSHGKDGYEFIEKSEDESKRKRKRWNPTKIIDIISRILFPVCFLVLNIGYWTISLEKRRSYY